MPLSPISCSGFPMAQCPYARPNCGTGASQGDGCRKPAFSVWGLREKWAIFEPFSLKAKLTAVTTVFPDTGLPQIPTQSKKLR